MDANRVLKVAAYAGKIILQSGAEIYRVEETITRICNSLGFTKVDAFVTINVIIICVENGSGESASITKRVKGRTQNLEKISQVNNISRHILDCKYTLEDVENKLKKVERLKPYSYKANIFSSGGASAFFCLVFGGNIRDFIISFLIGCLVNLTSILLKYLQSNEFFINTICGALVAFIALLSTSLNLAVHSGTIIIGSLMVLVPGLSITNSIRDTIAGDLLSGILGAVDAILVASAIAVGTGVVMKLWIVL